MKSIPATRKNLNYIVIKIEDNKKINLDYDNDDDNIDDEDDDDDDEDDNIDTV